MNDAPPPSKYHEIHEELAALAAAALIECGVSIEKADQWAECVKERIRKSSLAGVKELYIPKSRYTIAYKRWAVLHRYDGSNGAVLAAALEIEERRVRELYDEARDRRRAPRSPE